MFTVVTVLSNILFQIWIIRKFMSAFFQTNIKEKGKEKVFYFLFFFVLLAVHLIWGSPILNIAANISMLYLVAQLYEGSLKKKILAVLLIYAVIMICDVFAVFSLGDYMLGGEYNEIASYTTTLYFGICEFIIEKLLMKHRRKDTLPPYCNILISIPIISIVLMVILVSGHLDDRIAVICISLGILFINLLIFFLYGVLTDAFMKLEESAAFERQAASYANQLQIMTQSEEKMKALRHDMKHHLYELSVLAEQHREKEISDYIKNMQNYMDNPKEYAGSGNHEIDSLLNYLLGQAGEFLDQVECKVSIPKELKISAFDLNVVIGNLLDNAILAASQAQKKWLSVVLNYEKGVLFIQIQNSYQTVKKDGDGNYLTTKQETQNHGIGLKNVRRIVNQNHGTMQITDSDQIFDVKVMLYV